MRRPVTDTRASSLAIGESTYGSDKAGLVCAYAFTPGQPGRAIDSDEAAALLAGSGRDEFLWLHFSLANTATIRWLRQHVGCPKRSSSPMTPPRRGSKLSKRP